MTPRLSRTGSGGQPSSDQGARVSLTASPANQNEPQKSARDRDGHRLSETLLQPNKGSVSSIAQSTGKWLSGGGAAAAGGGKEGSISGRTPRVSTTSTTFLMMSTDRRSTTGDYMVANRNSSAGMCAQSEADRQHKPTSPRVCPAPVSPAANGTSTSNTNSSSNTIQPPVPIASSSPSASSNPASRNAPLPGAVAINMPIASTTSSSSASASASASSSSSATAASKA